MCNRCIVTLVALVCVASTARTQSAGDFGSAVSGPWGAKSTWRTWDGSAWIAADTLPSRNDNVFVLDDDTVTIESSPKYCRNLTVRPGALLRVNQTTNRYLRIHGSTVTNEGTIGGPADGLCIEAFSSLSIAGNGQTTLSRLRPGASVSGITVTFDADVRFTYAGSGGTGGVALYALNSSNDDISYVIAAGRMVAFNDFSGYSTGSSFAQDFGVNTSLTVHGTMLLHGNADLSLRVTSTRSSALTVSGTLSIGRNFFPASVTGGRATIAIPAGGTLAVCASGAGTADFSNPGQTVVGEGTFALAVGGTLAVGSPEGVTAAGSAGAIQTATRLLSPAASYAFVGNGVQSTGDGTPDTVKTLRVANSIGLALARSTTADSLVLSAGVLYLGGASLRANGVRVAGSNCMVVTDGAGVLALPTVPAGTTVFPVAAAADEATPVSITSAPDDSADVFRVGVREAIDPPAPSDAAVHRTWVIAEEHPGHNSVSLTFSWPASLHGPSFIPASALLWRHTGNAWVPEASGSVAGTDPVTMTAGSAITAFGPFAIALDSALPVQLSSFTVVLVAAGARLEWATLSEVNNYGFEVERAHVCSGPWSVVSPLIPGFGTTTESHRYTFVDSTAPGGPLFYRLRQMDLARNALYTAPVEASGTTDVDPRAATPAFHLSPNFPNPFNPSTVMTFTVDRKGESMMEVFNALGERVAVPFSGATEPGRLYEVRVNGRGLPSGVYFSRLRSGNHCATRAIVLVK